jgi:hypothetical protein
MDGGDHTDLLEGRPQTDLEGNRTHHGERDHKPHLVVDTMAELPETNAADHTVS